MLRTLLAGYHDSGAYMQLCKGFVLRDWVNEAIVHFKDHMERCELVCASEIPVGFSADSIKHLSGGVVHFFGIDEAFAISFGLHKASFFFSGICDNVKVYVGV
ncbi:hypothetical protein G9A89_023308 [Geosiphon pyriformis]|nr:hypothetical protein G9A89_023308 [Geosiphon pyriformis]